MEYFSNAIFYHKEDRIAIFCRVKNVFCFTGDWVKSDIFQRKNGKSQQIRATNKSIGRSHLLQVKGMIQIPEPAKESVIDQLYYYDKAAWRNQKSEPYDFHLVIADWKCQPEMFIKNWQELIFYLTNQENKLY